VARAKGSSTRTKNPPDVSESDAPLYSALVDWRLRQSRAASAPAYVIFPNTTLAAIATARPRSASALLDVPGVGPVKADRYGEAVLALVAEHAH
jgi:superfamily II DNA helicase RecQ